MTHAHLQTCRVAQLLQCHLPPPRTTAVATTAISSNQDLLDLGVHLLAHALPPLLHGRHSTFSGIMIDANADPATVLRHIIDAVRDRFAQAFVHKVMHTHRLRHALWLILPPPVGKVPDSFFFLRIDRDHWLAAMLKRLDL